MKKKALFGLNLEELKDLSKSFGLPAFTGRQIAQWLYQKNVGSIDDMTNLSMKARALLNESYEIGLTKAAKVQMSTDGTKKYLYAASNNQWIETAYIPDKERATLCVSSQVGCKMGCLFCMTGKQGFQSNLTAGEIVNQLQSLPERDHITNMVYMGMGEPLDNLDEVLKSIEILTSDWGYAWSPRRITLSTIGLIPAMKEFLERSEAHLAVSLHSPFEEERKNLMPIESVYPLHDLIKAIKSYDFGGQRRISFEYIMFKDVNDTDAHIKALVRLLNGLKCRINLIRFHPIPDTPLESTGEERLAAFKDALNNKGILTTIRASRGQDIYAACGLLSTKELVKKETEDY